MRKFIIIFLALSIILPAQAATNDFTADGNITVDSVTFGAGTADMLIMNGSTAESWIFNSGTFTVTNPGTFKVGSSDSSVKSIKVTQGGTNLACAENSTPGTSYVTVPTTAGTYTIEPSATTDCTSLCTALDNAATYNSFPTCGAATCDSGYELSGSGASATCVQSSSGSVSIPSTPPPPTTFQTYDPITGELIIEDITEEEPESTEPETTASETIIESHGEPAIDSTSETTLEQMSSDAETIATGDVSQVVAQIGAKRDLTAEINFSKTITAKIISGLGITAQERNAINNFIIYGTPATKILGAGERGGAVNSFRAAFGKAPTSASDWSDIIKIANGRWPSKTSEKAEDRANINFKIVYLRSPNISNPHDDAAITVMAYGLRPAQRNLNSEKAAIKIFKDIYGYSPKKATAWDVVRAIAYSGAIR